MLFKSFYLYYPRPLLYYSTSEFGVIQNFYSEQTMVHSAHALMSLQLNWKKTQALVGRGQVGRSWVTNTNTLLHNTSICQLECCCLHKDRYLKTNMCTKLGGLQSNYTVNTLTSMGPSLPSPPHSKFFCKVGKC